MIVLDINQTNGKHSNEYIEVTVDRMLRLFTKKIQTNYGPYMVSENSSVIVDENTITNYGFIMSETGFIVLGFRSMLFTQDILEIKLCNLLNSYKPNTVTYCPNITLCRNS